MPAIGPGRPPGKAAAATIGRPTLWVAGVGFLLLLLNTTPAASPPEGQALFERRCGGCHALDRDKEGPRLGGVYGRAAGSVESFEYSEALRKSGIRWTADALGKWLTDTESLVPGNDMSFRVTDAGERAAIIEFLQRNSGR